MIMVDKINTVSDHVHLEKALLAEAVKACGQDPQANFYWAFGALTYLAANAASGDKFCIARIKLLITAGASL